MLTLISLTWLYIGMYGYIYWVNKYNQERSKKWRKRQVKRLPLMACLGVFTYIAGLIINKQRNNGK